jgi:hypothetical protein
LVKTVFMKSLREVSIIMTSGISSSVAYSLS